MIDEVKRLKEEGYEEKNNGFMQGIGYRQVFEYLEGNNFGGYDQTDQRRHQTFCRKRQLT